MRVGDRVSHKKHGLGRVKSLYPKYNAARVVFDSGHETTNALKRLRVVPDGWGVAKESAGPPAPTQPSAGTAPVRGRRGPGDVDYGLLDEVRQYFTSRYPDADHVAPRIYDNRVYVELWRGNSASIHFYDQEAA